MKVELTAQELNQIVVSLDSTLGGIHQSINQAKPDERPQLRALSRSYSELQDKCVAELEKNAKSNNEVGRRKD